MRAWSDEYCVEKFMDPERQRPLVRAVEDDERQQERVPGRHDQASTLTVASAGRESGRRTRQKKPNELQPSIAGGVLELRRDAPEERAQDDDRERQREGGLRQRDAERVAEEARGSGAG